MADDLTIGSGTGLYVSAGVPATYDAAGYAALVWTEVGEVESLPDFGGKATVATFTALKDGIVNKKKGSIDYGEMAIPLGMKTTDTGQAALMSAFDGANKNVVHSVKVSNSEIGVIYFTAETTSYTYNIGDANAITKNTVTFAVKTKPIFVSTVYTVTYVSADAHGTIIGEAVQLVISGGTTTPVYAAPIALYEFTKWLADNSTANPRSDTGVVASVTYTATFTLI